MREHVYILTAASILACGLTLTSTSTQAHEGIITKKVSSADDHAPIGVMGDHMHKKGEWMAGYRFMHGSMDENINGNDDISDNQIVTTQTNRFSGEAGQPATLRVVPTEMKMNMHMFGMMYAPSDWLTLVASSSYKEKEMTMKTYAGGAGTTVRGFNTITNKGFGDTKLTGLWLLHEDDIHHWHLNTALSLPTGSIDKSGVMLMPSGARSSMRMSYGMQLGTGTYDFMPGLTYYGHKGLWGWGAQYMGEIRLEDENDEGYAWGDKHKITAWGSYEWKPWVSNSLRIDASTQDSIDGVDSNIIGASQGADPDNYGGDFINLAIGVNFMDMKGAMKGHRLGIEAIIPVYQDVNGLQMKRAPMIIAGWQYAF